MTYLLRLSPEHARAVLGALELHFRLAMGQTKYLAEMLEDRHVSFQKCRDRGSDAVLHELKRIYFPDIAANGAYYGIMHEKTGHDAHLCYEVFNALRHRTSWTERPLKEGEFAGRSHDEPCLFPSGVTPRPECASEDGKRPELEKSPYRLVEELRKLIGTDNIAEAVELVRGWKEKGGGEMSVTAIRAKKSRLWHYEKPTGGAKCGRKVNVFERWLRTQLGEELCPEICPQCEKAEK